MRAASANRIVLAVLVLATVARPAIAAPAGAATAACYGTQHTLVGGANQQINVTSYGLFYDCAAHVWQLDITTSDNWAPTALSQLNVVFNTDGNPATGCSGYDRALVADSYAGLEAVVLVTPTCDTSTSFVAARAVIVQAQPNQLLVQFTNNDLGNPSSFAWHGTVQGTADAKPEEFPTAPDWSEIGFPPVPPDNPCTTLASNQVVLLGDPSQTPAAVTALRRAGMRSVRSGVPGVLRFTGDPRAGASALAGAGLAAEVSTDRVVHYHDVPNDPGYQAQWNLPVVNAPTAWSTTHGSPSIIVADLDTGVDASHADLQGQLLPGFDVAQGSPLPMSNTDVNGHGTAVAGVIAAATNNGTALAGLGWSTKVMEVKLSDPPTIADIVAGITWATDHGARIINLSLGGCGDPTELAAVRYAQQHGVLVVASAGNDALDGNPVEYPAAYPGVIGVGATGRDGTRALYSEAGPQVALVAPGGSADGRPSDDIPVLAPGSTTAAASGTSFSAPQVAAAAALVLAVNPTLTADDAGALAVATAAPIRSSPDGNYGRGMLNAAAAVKAAGILRRAAGPDRYATSAAMAALGWSAKTAGTVYVASGETFADALGTGAAASINGAPILLTNSCGLPPSTAAQLVQLKPTAIFLVGGTAAVCPSVADAITEVTGVTPRRVSGADRYATNAELVDATWPTTTPVAYVATGANFPDGLTGSARAAKDGAPLLLTDSCALPAVTRAELGRLAPKVVKVLGGVNSVCAGVIDAITAATSGAQVVRLAGANRVQTGVIVAADGWSQASSAIVASAGNFPDALSAAAFAALNHVPLLINDTCSGDPPVAAELQTLGATTVTVAGGSAALCGAAVAPLAVALSH